MPADLIAPGGNWQIASFNSMAAVAAALYLSNKLGRGRELQKINYLQRLKKINQQPPQKMSTLEQRNRLATKEKPVL